MSHESLTAVKVISCRKFKDIWKIKCIEEADLSKSRGISFDNRAYKETELTSTIPLKSGTHFVRRIFDEDIEGSDGKERIVYRLVSEELEESDSLDLISNDEEVVCLKKDSKIDFWDEHYLEETTVDDSLSFERSELEFDYLKIKGDLNNFNVKRESDRRRVANYFKSMGLEVKSEKENFILFENKETGIRAYFSNFRGGKEEYGHCPSISVDFSGQFFIKKNADIAARKLMRYFTKSFGVIFTVSRVDIRQDIYEVVSPRDYFPDFLDTKKHHWSLRTQPSINLHHNGFLAKETGFTVKNSRYQIVSYNRNLALEDKHRSGKCEDSYYNYYKKLYNGRNVQRLEVRLTQKDSCAAFMMMFMHESYDKRMVLKYTMASFAKTHVLRDVGKESRESRYKVNSTFAELFYLDEKENFKKFRSLIEQKEELKFSDAIFTPPEDRSGRMMRNFGKSFCMVNTKETITQTLENLRGMTALSGLRDSIEENKSVINDKKERFKKSLKLFTFSEEELLEIQLALSRGGNIAASYS